MLIEVMVSSGREVRDVFRAATTTHRRLRNVLVTVAVVTLGVDLMCAILGYFRLERHAHETEIKTLGSAAFWTTTQLLTSPRRSRTRSRPAGDSWTSSWRSMRSP